MEVNYDPFTIQRGSATSLAEDGTANGCSHRPITHVSILGNPPYASSVLSLTFKIFKPPTGKVDHGTVFH